MDTIKKTKLGQKIKTARLSAQFSQKQLGYKLKLSDKAVSSYEVGRATPSLDVLKKISQLTNHPLKYFVEHGSIEVDLELKLNRIEQELQEIKDYLRKQKSSK